MQADLGATRNTNMAFYISVLEIKINLYINKGCFILFQNILDVLE